MTVPVGSVPVEGIGSSTSSAVAQTSVGTTSVTALASNAARRECIVQNTGTTVIFLGLGQTPTNVNYHVALKSCTVSNDGTGGVFVSDLWTGAINAIGSAASGTIVVTELT